MRHYSVKCSHDTFRYENGRWNTGGEEIIVNNALDFLQLALFRRMYLRKRNVYTHWTGYRNDIPAGERDDRNNKDNQDDENKVLIAEKNEAMMKDNEDQDKKTNSVICDIYGLLKEKQSI